MIGTPVIKRCFVMSQGSVQPDVVKTDENIDSVSSSVKVIGARIKEMREILDISKREMAEKLGISGELYEGYENGSVDIPIGIIYKAAGVMNVDSTLLLTGEDARMSGYTIVRKGNGQEIERYPGYSFKSLAVNFIGRTMDPMIVTIKADDLPAKLVSHGGNEFNYVLEGTIIVTIKDREFVLDAGDSIYFDPSAMHGQRAVSPVARFLTVINE